MEGKVNIFLLFFHWWYGEAPVAIFAFIKKLYIFILDQFSVTACLTTIFMPWRRDQYNLDGLSLVDKFKIGLLNLVSRFVGFAVKLCVLVVFCVVFLFITLINSAILLFYYLYPATAVILLVYGVILVFS